MNKNKEKDIYVAAMEVRDRLEINELHEELKKQTVSAKGNITRGRCKKDARSEQVERALYIMVNPYPTEFPYGNGMVAHDCNA